MNYVAVCVQTVASVVFIVSLSTSSAFAAEAVLFPTPLHLTRSVDDPVSHRTTVIEEYCAGNKVVSVAGPRTIIADYAKRQVTEIRRDEGTYSVTSFEQIAQVDVVRGAGARSSSATTAPSSATSAVSSPSTRAAAWSIHALGRREKGNNADYFDTEPKVSGLKKLEVGIDHSQRLSKDAVEVLLGSAYPRNRSEETEFFMRAAAPAAPSDSRTTSQSVAGDAANGYGLPVDQVITYDVGGEELVMRNRVTKVASDPPPPEALLIPPGAKLIESTAVTLKRTIEDLDRLPSVPPVKP